MSDPHRRAGGPPTMAAHPPGGTDPPADIRDWLDRHPGLTAAEVVDALQHDQLRRWRAGERVPAEAYLQLLAGAGADDGQALDLIYAEFLLRRDGGESPTLDEYCWRFPGFVEQIRLLADLERELDRHPRPAAGDPGTVVGDPVRPTGPTQNSPLPRVPGYDVLGELGRGGVGVVYRARDRALGRLVAVKLVRTGDDEGRARLLLEAEAVARVQHPNIVQIYEVGEAGDGPAACPYLALEYADGGTLAQHLRGGPLPPRRAAGLVETVARAVHYAHQRGILHRDLKPGNILLTGGGGEQSEVGEGGTGSSPPADPRLPTPKVADFGLAKRLDGGDQGRTRTGAVLGTPGYMAPEQVSGSGDVGTPADVYALGAILYECLTGNPPFQARTPLETLEQVRSRDPVSPGRVRPGVPRDLETICLTCLRKEPERRYASAAALAEDLARFLAGKAIQARRSGPVRRATLWCRRNPALATAILAGVAVAAGVAVVGVVGVVHERDRYRGERDHARTNLYRALVGETRALMKARDTGWWWRAMDNLKEAGRLEVAARDPSELRDLAVECMGTEEPCFRLDGTWAGHGGPVTAVGYRPDGRVAASGSRDATVRLWSVPDGRPLGVLSGHGQAVTGVAFAPDGKRLASGSADGTVRVWDADSPGRPPVRVFDPHAGPITQLGYTLDGAWLAAGCGDGTIRVFPAAADRPEKVLRGHSGRVTALAFSAAGVFASGGADLTIRFWDITAEKQTQAWTTLAAPSSLAFHPSPYNDQVVWTDHAGAAIWSGRLHKDQRVQQTHIHSGGVTQVRPTPWDRWLTASADGTLKLWADGGGRMIETGVARGEFGAVLSAAVAPDGRGTVAGYDDGRVRLWRMEPPPQQAAIPSKSHNVVFVGGRRLFDNQWLFDLSGGPPGTLHRYMPSPVRALAVDPAGRALALGRADGALERWVWPERRELARWAGHARAVNALATGPAGRFASASDDGTVKLWRWEAVEPERTLDPGVGAVHAVAWGGDGRHLAASGERGVVLWDLRVSSPPRRLSDRALPVSAVAVGPGVVAFSEADGVIELRDLTTGAARHLRGHTAPVAALAFSPDGTRFGSGAADGSIRVWDPATGVEVDKVAGDLMGRTLAFDRAGRYLLCPTHPLPILFDLRARHAVAQLDGVRHFAHAVGFGPDEADLLFAADDGGVIACPVAEVARARTAAGEPTGPVRVEVPSPFTPGGHAHAAWGIAASPDGRWVATAGHDRVVKVWDAGTMSLVRTLEGHRSIVWSVAFSPDSRRLASGSVGETAGDVRVWEVETGRLVRQLAGHAKLVTALAFHPHRPWLVSGSLDGSVRLWDASRWEPVGEIHRFDRAVHDLAFRPDGRRLAAATGDPRLAVWEVAEGPPAGPPGRLLAGHAAGVRSVAFSPDGRVLASGSDQGTVILWGGETLDRLASLRAGSGQIRGLSFSPDGGLLAAAGYTARTVVWDLGALRRTLHAMNLDW